MRFEMPVKRHSPLRQSEPGKRSIPVMGRHLLRFEFTENERLQIVHVNGFSPVCMCECTARAEGLEKVLLQTVHAWNKRRIEVPRESVSACLSKAIC
jgi:hypothetical protein